MLRNVFMIAVLCMCGSAAFAQATLFTCQGRLTYAGQPANGQYDLVFRLFDPSGSQIGRDRVRDDMEVSNSFFHVTLDFGSSPFAVGATDSLEVAVRRKADTGKYTSLARRQLMTSSGTILEAADYSLLMQCWSGLGAGNGTGTSSGAGNGTGNGSESGSGLGTGTGRGLGTGSAPKDRSRRDDENSTGTAKLTPPAQKTITPLKILSKPTAPYTDVAKKDNIAGTVTLKIVFLASGQIGSISVIQGLPDGLTEKAIEAARKIKFEPKKVDGLPQTVSMPMQYNFNIY